MLIKKYENLLKQLNQKISDGTFSIEENKEKLEQIIEIYTELKAKNYEKAKLIISSLDFSLFTEFLIKESYSRDWDIETEIDEDNVEAFNSIEMMSAIFLQNIKNQLGTQI